MVRMICIPGKITKSTQKIFEVLTSYEFVSLFFVFIVIFMSIFFVNVGDLNIDKLQSLKNATAFVTKRKYKIRC